MAFIAASERVVLSADAAALVLESSGTITPEQQPYSEIPASATLKLDSSARLVFLDYQTCMQVTMSGGELKFGPDGYLAKGGTPSSERIPCPTRLHLQNPGEVAGIYMRGSGDEPQTITTRPNFVVVGSGGDDFESCELLKDHREVVTTRLVNHHCELPPDGKSLDSNGAYELILAPKSSASQPIKIDLIASTPEAKPGKSLFLIPVH